MGSRFSDFLFSLLPFLREVIHHIVTVHIPCFAGDEDKRLWIPDNHGIFSTKSAVDVICYQKALLPLPMPAPITCILQKIWNAPQIILFGAASYSGPSASRYQHSTPWHLTSFKMYMLPGYSYFSPWILGCSALDSLSEYFPDIDTASVLSCLPSWFTIPLNSTFGYLQPILVWNELWRARNAAIFEVNMKRLSFVLHLQYYD